MTLKDKVKKKMQDSYEIKISPSADGYEGTSDSYNNYYYPNFPKDEDCKDGEGPYHPDAGKRVILTRSIEIEGWTVRKGMRGIIRKAYPQKERIYEGLRDTVKEITRPAYRIEISFSEHIGRKILLDPDAFAII